MGVAIGLSGTMVTVVPFKGRHLFEPVIDILPQAGLMIIDNNACSNMHGRHQHHTLSNPAVVNNGLYFVGYVYKSSLLFSIEPEIFGLKFHRHDSVHKLSTPVN